MRNVERARELPKRVLRRVQSRSAAPAFHKVWYDTRIWQNVTWQGVPLRKNPFDLWIHQEVIHDTRPDLIIETGTLFGGSALYFSHLLDIQGDGSIVTVDVEARPGRAEHPRITYLTGSSTDPEIIERLARFASEAERVMVVLDSDHTEAHVREELRLLSPLVTVGNYLVVEDTNVNGHPVRPSFGPGPMEAVEGFLGSTKSFVRDIERERFLMTFNPSGWLRRIAATTAVDL